MSKPFNELTDDEATRIIQQIVRSSQSRDEIKYYLKLAGFDDKAAAIASCGCGGLFSAMILVHGPNGKTIGV